MAKRTLDSFFTPPTKKTKQTVESFYRGVSPPLANNPSNHEKGSDPVQKSTKTTAHATYPWPIAELPPDLSIALEELLGTSQGKEITNQPHLDLLYFQPLIPQSTANQLFKFLRANLPFYRVCYKITRFGKSLDINTPRFTTVFGMDETSQFLSTSTPNPTQPSTMNLETRIVETANPATPAAPTKYKTCTPRPIPPCLAVLKNLTEALTHDTYNFILVNYYATGNDSISYHADDEHFLGPNPTIASYTLGARRDFLLKHKPIPQPTSAASNGRHVHAKDTAAATTTTTNAADPLKFSLGSGDMLLMRGETQANWMHSIPKRKSGEADRGRINITLRKAMVPAGTENYYRYNVGDGPVYRWDEGRREMVLWEKD